MATCPPSKRIECPAINTSVPISVLVWKEYQQDHFYAEPMPGYRFYVTPNADDFGWLFYLPGQQAHVCTKRHIACGACEQFWFKAVARLLNSTGSNEA